MLSLSVMNFYVTDCVQLWALRAYTHNLTVAGLHPVPAIQKSAQQIVG